MFEFFSDFFYELLHVQDFQIFQLFKLNFELINLKKVLKLWIHNKYVKLWIYFYYFFNYYQVVSFMLCQETTNISNFQFLSKELNFLTQAITPGNIFLKFIGQLGPYAF
jgi:hypothetical protein